VSRRIAFLTLFWERWDGGEEADQAFGKGGVGDDEVADSGVGQVVGHGQLDRREEFACAGAEGGEAEDAVVKGDEGFEKAAGFGEGAGAQDGEHGDLRETVGDSLLFGFRFGEAYVGQLGIDEGAGRDLASGGGAVGSGEVVADCAEVVEGDVGEVWRASAVAHGPDARCGGFEAVVDLDVAGWGGLDADEFEAHVLGVGSATSGYEDVRACEDSAIGKMEFYVCAGETFNAADGGVGNDVDAFVVEELLDGFGDIGVFAVGEGGVALDDGDAGAEAPHGLGEFKTDVAAADDEEMFGYGVELEGFDVGERMSFEEAGDGVDGRAGAGVDEDLVGGEDAGATGVEVDLDGFGADEFAKAHRKFCAVLFEVV